MTVTDKNVMSELRKICFNLTEDELVEANRFIVQEIKHRRSTTAYQKKAQMSVGMRVKTTQSGSGLFAGDEGVIEKINPKKIKVRFDRKPNIVYTCPAELLEVV
jgi:hypothetical protein